MHSCSSPENHIRIPVQNGQSLYPFSDQKGPKAPPFGAANTYMAYIMYQGVPPHPPPHPPARGESSHCLPIKKSFYDILQSDSRVGLKRP